MPNHTFPFDSLVNITQELVGEQLAQIIDNNEAKFCHCDVCLLDILAITLNNTPPMYWGNQMERASNWRNAQPERIKDIQELAHSILLQAIMRVTKNPHH